MKRPNLGPCQTCLRAPATSVCIATGMSEVRLCNRCTPTFWQRVNDWLASRGIFPVGGA